MKKQVVSVFSRRYPANPSQRKIEIRETQRDEASVLVGPCPKPTLPVNLESVVLII